MEPVTETFLCFSVKTIEQNNIEKGASVNIALFTKIDIALNV